MMHTRRHLPLWMLLAVAALIAGCRKEPIYGVETVGLRPFGAHKDREKTNTEYAAILHANLFQTALSANDLYKLDQCIQSIGDKELAREVLISNFMNKPGVIIPSDSLMRADVDAFVTATYERFLVRFPTEAEKTWFRHRIQADPQITAEMVYFSFALSEEYLFY